MPKPSRQIDQPFSVPFVHRLRVTEDIVGNEFDVLLDLLKNEPPPNEDSLENASGVPRVLLIGESSLAPQVSALENRLNTSAEADLVAPAVLVEGGEAIKNGEHVLRSILDLIHQHGLDRRSYVLALGGGAMLDAVGFASAIAHRGIRLIRLPSTVLAQADSGVGVKNAINYFEKKNWIGTFAVPWAVVNDAKLLTTLPDRDFHSGFSEAVKVALLKDPASFEWLCQNAKKIFDRDPDATQRAIECSCRQHLMHITAGGDPFEMLEARPLDFGHWSAHRLEPITQYQIRHGEAVAIGVALDCLYSSRMYGFPEQTALAVVQCLSTMGMTLWHEAMRPADRLLQGLEEFRQHLGGRLTITMLRDVGDPVHVHQIDHDVMAQCIDQLAPLA